VAALLSLFINKHGQKGIVILISVELIQVVLKESKREKICSLLKKHSSDYFTVVVKSNGDISPEPVRTENRGTCCDRLRSK